MKGGLMTTDKEPPKAEEEKEGEPQPVNYWNLPFDEDTKWVLSIIRPFPE